MSPSSFDTASPGSLVAVTPTGQMTLPPGHCRLPIAIGARTPFTLIALTGRLEPRHDAPPTIAPISCRHGLLLGRRPRPSRRPQGDGARPRVNCLCRIILEYEGICLGGLRMFLKYGFFWAGLQNGVYDAYPVSWMPRSIPCAAGRGFPRSSRVDDGLAASGARLSRTSRFDRRG